MPYRDLEKRKECVKRYHQEHKVEIKEYKARWLKDWRNAHWDEYYQEHKEELKAKARRMNRRIKFLALAGYSNGNKPECDRCGIDDLDVLTIDHINGGGNRHRKQLRVGSGTNFFYWLKRNNYPQGFQVLCWNCNVKKRFAEGC